MGAPFNTYLDGLNASVDQVYAPDVEYRPKSGTPASYSLAGVPVDPNELEAPPAGARLLLSVTTSELQTVPERGDVVVFDGEQYRVTDFVTDLGERTMFGLGK